MDKLKLHFKTGLGIKMLAYVHIRVCKKEFILPVGHVLGPLAITFRPYQNINFYPPSLGSPGEISLPLHTSLPSLYSIWRIATKIDARLSPICRVYCHITVNPETRA